MRIGLVVRSAPFSGRSARDQLDIALASAALDHDLELIFLGAGLQQLLPDHEPHAAGLPRGSRGWKSLPGLTHVKAYATAPDLEALGVDEGGLLLPVEAKAVGELPALMAGCDRVLVV